MKNNGEPSFYTSASFAYSSSQSQLERIVKTICRFDQSHKKRKDSLEARAVLKQISMLS